MFTEPAASPVHEPPSRCRLGYRARQGARYPAPGPGTPHGDMIFKLSVTGARAGTGMAQWCPNLKFLLPQLSESAREGPGGRVSGRDNLPVYQCVST